VSSHRSTFLVYWTGKDIPTDPSLTHADRAQFVDRLVDIVQNGFWMTKPSETLVGSTPSGASVTFHRQTYMTCFTELRLSASRQHANAFGLLGIGVDRSYVLERWGTPVHYVRNQRDEGVVGAFHQLRYLITRAATWTGKDDALTCCDHLGVFIKGMSSSGTDDFAFLDEQEWRVVAFDEQVKRRRIVQTTTPPPDFRLLLQPSDLRIVVFPDDVTRSLALADARVRHLTSLLPNPIHMLTLSECEQF
jgi:hypothetical protein